MVVVLLGFATPVPASDTVLGLPTALCAMLRLPERTLAAVGVKAMAMVQLADTASEIVDVHVPADADTVNSAPVTLIAETCSGDAPVFRNVTVCAALVVPTLTCPNGFVEIQKQTGFDVAEMFVKALEKQVH